MAFRRFHKHKITSLFNHTSPSRTVPNRAFQQSIRFGSYIIRTVHCRARALGPRFGSARKCSVQFGTVRGCTVPVVQSVVLLSTFVLDVSFSIRNPFVGFCDCQNWYCNYSIGHKRHKGTPPQHIAEGHPPADTRG